MLRPTGQPPAVQTTVSSPGSSASDSRYTWPPTSTSKRWILRYTAAISPSGSNTTQVFERFRRPVPPPGRDPDACVRELLPPLASFGDRAADERDPVAARPAGHRLDGLAA